MFNGHDLSLVTTLFTLRACNRLPMCEQLPPFNLDRGGGRSLSSMPFLGCLAPGRPGSTVWNEGLVGHGDDMSPAVVVSGDRLQLTVTNQPDHSDGESLP